ncbi:hypothetical protein EYC80_007414 [Monilinia laxa]|uniref:Uncharacterized protein n=1 Tax=Monilinia laxa TaxID=61186 RepID=A0A5N6JV33_MONLA|nr:hypothetical protein EYC80_007414 [Monilinia laxa]
MSSEFKSFLSDEERSESEVLRKRSNDSNIHWRAILFHISLIVAYSIIFLFFLRRSAVDVSTSVHPIPGLKIQFLPVTPLDLPSSPYAGPPSDAVDQAWHDLLSNMNIRVTTEELEKNPTIEHWDIHADHCFDVLRNAVMCQGDTTLITFGWDKLSKPQPHVKSTEHRCVDWDVLIESLADRVVGSEEMAALVNPRLKPDA